MSSRQIPKHLRMPKELVDRVQEVVPIQAFYVCQSCGKEFPHKDMAYWLDGDLCRECAQYVSGRQAHAGVVMLLSRGTIRLLHFVDQNVPTRMMWRVRVEVRARDYTDLIAIRTILGGNIHAHGTLWKWATQSSKVLSKVAKVVRIYIPELGDMLTRYTLQSGEDKSAFAEAVRTIMGPTIRFRDYLTFGQEDGR